MSSVDRDRVLLAQLLELPEAERAALMRRACASDQGLDHRVHSWNGSQPPGLAAISALKAALNVVVAENSGANIGPYKLLQQIGEGGFGVVWMAEQTEPIKRRVALKIIKVGMDTEEVIARFEAERQALALMEHPNIARVFDAGATDSGRPYFVMELVRGVAITRYCDDNRLSAEARLRLFVTVCQAVQHAHQKGVIHRDLKPSNILVTLHDGLPVPKVIDFGIAKATSARLTEKTLFTQFNAFIGTPAYTSPEQMEMSGLDVDTRSDIYSLGVLLYELLTGEPPFDSKTLMASGLEAMRRTVREIDPPPPSHRLGTLTEVARTSIAQHRGTDAAKLSILLRGDLDWIAMRCLEKDRTRRYDSATGLAADVERHLNDDLVEARPPSHGYRVKKFIRRHKFGVFAVSAVAATLIAGLITSSALFVLERSAHNRAAAAEKTEGELRRQAEVAQASEAKRAARTALDLANRNLADGHVADGLAYLVYASQKDPENTTLGPRLVSALTSHNFLLPDGPAFECGSRVRAVHFTKGGQSVYVGTEDGVLRVFDPVSHQLQREVRLPGPVLADGWDFPRDNDAVFAVRFADNTLGVIDVKSGLPLWTPRELGLFTRPEKEPTVAGRAVGISPDGRWVFVTEVRRFAIWNAATGADVLVYESDDRIGGCSFTPDGAQLVVTVGTSLRRWTLPELAPIPPTAGFTEARPPSMNRRDNLRMVTLSPSGRYVAVAGHPNGIALYDGATGNFLRTFRPSRGLLEFPSVAFASENRIFGAGEQISGSWDNVTGEFTPLPVPLGWDLLTKSFDAAGDTLLTTAADGLVRICSVTTGKLAAEPAWHPGACATLAPDGVHVVIGSATGRVQRYRIGSGKAQPLALLRAWQNTDAPGVRNPLTNQLAGSPSSPAVFMPGQPTRLLWLKRRQAVVIDVASGREMAGGFAYPAPILRYGAPSGQPLVRRDIKFLVAQTAGGVQAWELGEGGVVGVVALQGCNAVVGEYRFSPHGDLVLVGQGRESSSFGVWNLRTGARVGPISSHPTYIRPRTLHFTPDGSGLTLGALDGGAMIIDVATHWPKVPFATRSFVSILSLDLSSDGTRVVTTNMGNETQVWNAATGEPLGPAHDTSATKLFGRTGFSPDGRWFATVGHDAAHLWDGVTGAPIGEPVPRGSGEVHFSADSRTLATANRSEARVWDVPSGQPFTEPMLNGTPSNHPEFSRDGRFLRVENLLRFHVWSVPPRLPLGVPIPHWLLQLATICASKKVDDFGALTDVPEAMAQHPQVVREIAGLGSDAPFAEWGRWILNDRPDRPLAPGFIVTQAEVEQLHAKERSNQP